MLYLESFRNFDDSNNPPMVTYTSDNKRQSIGTYTKGNSPTECAIRDGVYCKKVSELPDLKYAEDAYLVDRCGNIFYNEKPGDPLRRVSDEEFIQAQQDGYHCARNLSNREVETLYDMIQLASFKKTDSETYNKGPLNGFSVDEIKKEISKQIKYDVCDIRLFGSRITGGWKDKSDLDIAIKDENKVDYDVFYGTYLGLNCEFRFVEDFEISWLRNSV